MELGREAELERRHAFAGGVGADLVGHATNGGGRLQHGQAQLEAAQRGGEPHPAREAELRGDGDPEARRQLSQRRFPQGAVEVSVQVGQGREGHRPMLRPSSSARAPRKCRRPGVFCYASRRACSSDG